MSVTSLNNTPPAKRDSERPQAKEWSLVGPFATTILRSTPPIPSSEYLGFSEWVAQCRRGNNNLID